MRKSRVLLAGVAVAAAAAATSAFTASNNVSGVTGQVLGYGAVHVTGATVTSVVYHRDGTDGTKLTDIVFTTSTTITTETGTLQLLNGTTPVGGPVTCSLGGSAGSQTFTCLTTAVIDSFDTVGLTVAS